MPEMVITPRREKGEKPLGSTGLLLLNPSEARHGALLARQVGGEQRFLFNSGLYQLRGEGGGSLAFVAGPAVGAPMAALTVEKLVALGARQLLVAGWCGSLQPEVKTGDLVLPAWGLSEEGTSRHYPVVGRAASDGVLQDLLADFFGQRGFAVHQGPVWSTDAPYREPWARVEEYRQQGIVGVEMEFAALAAVASFRQIRLAGALLVSDELASGIWQPGFRNRRFQERSRLFVEALFEFTNLCAAAAGEEERG